MVVAGDASPDGTMPDATWLAKLPQHPIFTAPATKFDDERGEEKGSCMAVRNADLIVSYGAEVRMASLLEVKHSQSASGSRSSYRILTSPTLNFGVERLLVNPTGTLLACVGSHRVAVVVLPRPGTFLTSRSSRLATNEDRKEIAVKAALVGPYYHHERIGGKARLTCVKWHPWGEQGTSLLVMGKDGTLREYNVATDVEEPVQSVNVLSAQPSGSTANLLQDSELSRNFRPRFPSKSRSNTPSAVLQPSASRSRRSNSRIAFEDDSASDFDESLDNGVDESFYTAAGSIRSSAGQGRTVVSFSFGIDGRTLDEEDSTSSKVASDWTPLTLYSLCSNGDLYALCPFLPTSAAVPFSYLHALASYVGLSRSASTPNEFDDRTGEEQSLRFVSSLLKQASAQRRKSVAPNSPPNARQRVSATPMSVDEPDRESSVDIKDGNGYTGEDSVLVQRPGQAIVAGQPLPQGPCLLSPAPHELSDERESLASDVFFSRMTRKGEELNVIGIASDDGKIDVCIALEPTKPIWPKATRERKQSSNPRRKAGRYVLSDSEDEELDRSIVESEAPAEELPILLVYESIDLGLLDSLRSSEIQDVDDALRRHSVRFVSDPLYPDTMYVSHWAGAHALGFGRWVRDILDAMRVDNTNTEKQLGESALQRVLHRSTPSDIANVVNTRSDTHQRGDNVVFNPIHDICIVSDIYLCYSFFALARSGALVALELSLRVEDTHEGEIDDVDVDLNAKRLDDQNALAYVSLLGDGPPFTPPEPFKSFRGLPSQPRKASAAFADQSGELRVTPESLRALATTVESMRGQMREIVQGGNLVQSRLELQMEELKRQLGKLDQANRQIEQRKASDVAQDALQQRIGRIMERQEAIARRSDRLLQRLIESHSPGLSVYEHRWLKELERLQKELGVNREGESSEAGLASRVEALRHRLDLLTPELEEATANGKQQNGSPFAGKREAKPTMNILGSKQLRDVEMMLANEAKVLSTNREKVLHLNALVRRQNRMYAM